jgi:F-type H+-transporting ATPase subunit b
MELVTPDIGLVFWTTVCFAILLFILRKFAWKPILEAISERERSIEDSLSKAEAAKEEMARLTNENEALLKQAEG